MRTGNPNANFYGITTVFDHIGLSGLFLYRARSNSGNCPSPVTSNKNMPHLNFVPGFAVFAIINVSIKVFELWAAKLHDSGIFF